MSNEKVILVVDDEADAVAITEAMLSEIEGVSTVSANDGESGLAKAREIGPDLMILDVQMLGMNGFDVFSELRQSAETKDIPVIMLTGVAEQTGLAFSANEMKQFLGSEPDAYIEKPVDPDVLQSTVSRLLEL